MIGEIIYLSYGLKFENFVGPGPVKGSNFSVDRETDWGRPVFY